MKARIVAAGFALLAAFASGPAAAQFVVEDPEVLAAIEEGNADEAGNFVFYELPNMIQELNNSYTEVDNSTQELALSQEEKLATTGPRGMSALARTPESYIPLDWRETLAQLEEPGGELEAYQDIYAEYSELEQAYLARVDSDVREQLDRQMVEAAAGTALNASVYEDSGERLERLNELADSIEEAEDPKAIWDLTARIGVENAMLTNELIRLQAMNQMVADRRRASQQQVSEQSYSLTAAEY